MKLKNKKISKCLLCKNKKLKKIYNLGNFFISNFVEKKLIKKSLKCPLTLMFCNNCHLLQLSHIAPQELMYKRFYWYRSGVTKTMKDGLKDIYNAAVKNVKLKKNDVVLDIGANDGTLLKYFKKKCITIGCEPANNLIKNLKKSCDYVINDFWSLKPIQKILLKKRLIKPKIITAIGMFYDLEEPNKFISDAAKILHDDGVFIAQLMCLKSMIKQNDLGNICHEHLEFYSLKSLKYLFENNGLEIFKIEENEINGGSFRLFCRKLNKGSIRLTEPNVLNSIKRFVKRIKENKKKTVRFINDALRKKKTIFLYGASTKGNTVLQYYGINNKQIPYAAERSKEKWGKYTIGSGIEIISEKKARKLNPDYFFVTPWGFIKEFIKREKKWLKNKGTFILPFPKFKLIK
jgi:NDP-4-keto-2,6-dideoxyhexose 3-C-methyltransferase